MKDATYILGKHRVYTCLHCGAKCHRPLQESDTSARPFPKPCDHCLFSLDAAPFRVVDTRLEFDEVCK